MDQVKFFKGCLPQVLLGPFLNTLSHMSRIHILLQSSQGSIQSPVEKTKIKYFVEILNNLESLIIFAENSILDV